MFIKKKGKKRKKKVQVEKLIKITVNAFPKSGSLVPPSILHDPILNLLRLDLFCFLGPSTNRTGTINIIRNLVSVFSTVF